MLQLLVLDYIAVLMPPIVNDPVAWSVGLSPSEPSRKFWSDQDTVCVEGWAQEKTYYMQWSSGLFRATNTVLCLLNTLQPSSSIVKLQVLEDQGLALCHLSLLDMW